MHIAYDIICLKMLFMHRSRIAHDSEDVIHTPFQTLTVSKL
jgi:hypothetical protein